MTWNIRYWPTSMSFEPETISQRIGLIVLTTEDQGEWTKLQTG